MRNFLTAAFFGVALMALSVTSAFAVDCAPAAGTFPSTATVNGPKPGCPCDIAQAEERQNDPPRIAAAATDKQVTKQNDNSIGMTCYDHALKLTSKLGMIFSDIPTTGVFPAANTRVFGTVYDEAFGTGANPVTGELKTLSNSLDLVLTDMMQSVADDFDNSLSDWLGATHLEFMSNFMDPINNLVTQLLAPLAAIQGAINTIQTVMDTLITTLDILNSLFPSLAPNWINTVITPMWNQIKTTLLTAVQTIQQQIMTQVVNVLTGFLTNANASLTQAGAGGDNPNDAAKGECSRIQRLWNPISTTGQELIGNFRPVEGGGTEQGTPYLNMMSILTKNVPGAGEFMQHEIYNVTNSAALQAALDDFLPGGALSGPGNTPSWPAAFGTVNAGTAAPWPIIGGAAMSAIRGAF